MTELSRLPRCSSSMTGGSRRSSQIEAGQPQDSRIAVVWCAAFFSTKIRGIEVIPGARLIVRTGSLYLAVQTLYTRAQKNAPNITSRTTNAANSKKSA